MKENQLEDYYLYLEQLQTKVDKFFKQQEPYIFCKEGCAHCCEEGQFPCSELEFSFLELGFMGLDDEVKDKILEKTRALRTIKEKTPDEVLQCECPFLINKK